VRLLGALNLEGAADAIDLRAKLLEHRHGRLD
jgi:hypothetical protein